MTIKYAEPDRSLYTIATRTVANMTLYVRDTGDDANPGTAALPMLTIQAAVNRIPKFVDHIVVIDIGAGSFTTFNVSNFVISPDGGIEVKGTLITATLASGLTSGTSTGGSKTTLTKTGAGWTVDDLRGRWVQLSPTNLYLILSNTATTLTIVGEHNTTMSGKVFVIRDNGTLLTDGKVLVTNIAGDNYTPVLTIQKLKLDTGISCGGITAGTNLQYLWGSSPAELIIVAQYCSSVTIGQSYVTGSGDGFRLQDVTYGVISECIAYLSDNSGLDLLRGYTEVYNCAFNDGTDGILQQSGESSVYTTVCNNNATSGVYIENTKMTANTLTGTGNTRFGMRIGKCCEVDIYSTITGVIGDYSFNNSFARTWATDFPSTGDIIIATDSMSRVERIASP